MIDEAIPSEEEIARRIAPYGDTDRGIRKSKPESESGLIQFLWRMWLKNNQKMKTNLSNLIHKSEDGGASSRTSSLYMKPLLSCPTTSARAFLYEVS